VKRLRKFTLIVVLFSIIAAVTVQSHDEPPKTVQERIEQERARVKTSAPGIERQHVWVIKPGKSGQAADSSLWYTNRYDRGGSLLEQTVSDTSGNMRSVSFYDNDNVWLEELSYVGNSLDDRTVFVYDSDSLISIIMSYDNSGRITGRLDYQYSTENQTIAVTKRGPLDSLQYRILYTFEPGTNFRHQIEVVQTNADGSLRTRVQNQYMEDRRAKKLVFGSDGRLTHSFSYTYTPQGDFSEIIKRTANDSIAFRQNFQYTSDGLLSSIIELDQSGLVTRTLRYFYDYFERVR
jgi:hypothetical protein